MEQGYCGRDCAACEVREDYGCGGCRATEGVPPHGPCPIAACCREKGLEGCGRCGALDCELLPERNGAPQTQTRLERLQLEALGGRERAAELAVGLRRLFWVWLGGELAVSLVGAVAAVLAAHSGSRLLLLVPGAVELAVCLVMGRILGRLGEEFRTVPPFLAAYGAVRVVSGVVRPLWAAGLLTLLQGVLRLVWIFGCTGPTGPCWTGSGTGGPPSGGGWPGGLWLWERWCTCCRCRCRGSLRTLALWRAWGSCCGWRAYPPRRWCWRTCCEQSSGRWSCPPQCCGWSAGSSCGGRRRPSGGWGAVSRPNEGGGTAVPPGTFPSCLRTGTAFRAAVPFHRAETPPEVVL